jgi:hypothetical protein
MSFPLLLGKYKSKDPIKFGIGHFINVRKMSRGLKMFLRKHEKSQSNHNGKVLEKLGKKLLSTGKKKKAEKRI